MKVSELSTKELAQYINADEDDILIPEMKKAAVGYIANHCNLTEEQIDKIPEMWIAVAALVSDMYDNRSVNVKEEGINKTVATILGMHDYNLL